MIIGSIFIVIIFIIFVSVYYLDLYSEGAFRYFEDYMLLWMIMFALVLFALVPYAAVKFGKPISRHKFMRNMFIYTVFIIVWFMMELFTRAGDPAVYDLQMRNTVYIYAAVIVAVPAVLGTISYNLCKLTRTVDVKMPARFWRVRPVKAVVMEVDTITAVEYEGKRYTLSKNFPFRLRDVAKVRIIEGEETAYLA